MLFKNIYQGIFLLLILFANKATALVIDDFNGEQLVASELDSIKSNAKTLPLTTSQRLNSLGGKRKLIVEGLAGSKNIKTRLVVEGGNLIHSQDSGAIGISRIIWDGDDQLNEINHKLGSYNLSADGSTKILLEVISFDSPLNSEVNLELKLYNGSKTIVSLRQSLSSGINKATSIEFPLKNFAATKESSGIFSLSKVSAVELKIDGLDQDIDLQLANITTDTCQILPNTNNQVVDACGLCNGDNSACRDCAGVINGKAKRDRCGICNGDGQSCLGCTLTDQSLLLGSLDSTMKEQANLTRRISSKILNIKRTPLLEKFLAEQKDLANNLQVKGWQIVWQLPIKSNSCSNQTFCSQQSTNGLLMEYQKISLELKLINEKLITRFQRLSEPSNEYQTLKKRNVSLYELTLALAAKVPSSQSFCS